MAVTSNLSRSVSENAPEIGGGVVGVGVPVTLRETLDMQDGQPFALVGEPGSIEHRLTRPSVAYGLGAGSLTGLLWMMGVGPRALEDFYLAHTLTAVSAGTISALMPKGGGNGGSTATATRGTGGGTATRQTTAQQDGEFAPAGGRSGEMAPAR